MATLHIANELVKAIANIMHPVGSIYISTSSTNPGNFLGGTWVAWGTGRFPIGIDPNNKTWFATSEKTGGDWNHYHSTGDHTLTIQEMPEH